MFFISTPGIPLRFINKRCFLLNNLLHNDVLYIEKKILSDLEKKIILIVFYVGHKFRSKFSRINHNIRSHKVCILFVAQCQSQCLASFVQVSLRYVHYYIVGNCLIGRSIMAWENWVRTIANVDKHLDKSVSTKRVQ